MGRVVTPAATIRYRLGGDNGLLRHALLQAWAQRCYWCLKVFDYSAVQIDHVVPRDADGPLLAKMRDVLGLPHDFDVDAVTNLAPICGSCNREKSDQDLTTIPLIVTKLKKAGALAGAIAKTVSNFRDASDLEAALLLATTADLDQAQLRSTFEVLAPAVAQRLADLSEHAPSVYVSRGAALEAEVYGRTVDVSLRLDEAARAAVDVLERVAGGVIDQALAEPLADLLSQIATAVGEALEGHDGGLGEPRAGSVELDMIKVSVTSVRFKAFAGAHLSFEFRGEFLAEGSAAIVRDNSTGDGLDDIQGEAVASGQFAFTLGWSPGADVGHFTFDEVEVDDIDTETTLDGHSSNEWWDES